MSEPGYYRKTTGGFPLDQYLTQARARELFDQARERPDADLDGSLAEGFHYYNGGPDGLRLRVHVMPIGEARIPTRFLEQLQAGAPSAP